MSPDTLTWRWLKSRIFFCHCILFHWPFRMSEFYCRMLLPSSSSLLISVTKNCVITLRADLSLRSFTCHWKDYFIRVMTTGKQMFHQVAKENLPCLCSTVLSKLFYFIGGNSKQLQEASCLVILFANLIPQPQKNQQEYSHYFWSDFLC